MSGGRYDKRRYLSGGDEWEFAEIRTDFWHNHAYENSSCAMENDDKRVVNICTRSLNVCLPICVSVSDKIN